MSPDTIDEWGDGHVEGRDGHDVIEDVLKEQDAAVCILDGLDIVV